MTQGWRFEEWTQKKLMRALEGWSGVVDEIVERLPVAVLPVSDFASDLVSIPVSLKPEGATSNRGLSPSAVLDLYPAIPPFVCAFLAQAKPAPLLFIAPE